MHSVTLSRSFCRVPAVLPLRAVLVSVPVPVPVSVSFSVPVSEVFAVAEGGVGPLAGVAALPVGLAGVPRLLARLAGAVEARGREVALRAVAVPAAVVLVRVVL